MILYNTKATESIRNFFGLTKKIMLENDSLQSHLLKTAFLAEEAGESSWFVIAALFHDIGHMLQLGEEFGVASDDEHALIGADWVSRWFSEDIVKLVRLHNSCEIVNLYGDRDISEFIEYREEVSERGCSCAFSGEVVRSGSCPAYRLRKYDHLSYFTDVNLCIDHFFEYLEIEIRNS